jgi:hypothetical protein
MTYYQEQLNELEQEKKNGFLRFSALYAGFYLCNELGLRLSKGNVTRALSMHFRISCQTARKYKSGISKNNKNFNEVYSLAKKYLENKARWV